MARQKVIVKRLAAIHDLGSMDVLCTDKTGTLTEAKIALDPADNAGGRPTASACSNSPGSTAISRAACAARSTPRFSEPHRMPLLDGQRSMKSRSISNAAVFRFWSSARAAGILVVKGAPEDVLKLSSRYELAGEDDTQPLDAAAMARAAAQFQALGEEGFRVLGIAWREEPATQSHVAVLDEKDLVFAGYAAFLDPPKAERGRCDRSA